MQLESFALANARACAIESFALANARACAIEMELTELQTKHEEIKDKVAQLGRFL
jgi:hypothetical protein